MSRNATPEHSQVTPQKVPKESAEMLNGGPAKVQVVQCIGELNVLLIQIRVILEDETSIEKIPPPD